MGYLLLFHFFIKFLHLHLEHEGCWLGRCGLFSSINFRYSNKHSRLFWCFLVFLLFSLSVKFYISDNQNFDQDGILALLTG